MTADINWDSPIIVAVRRIPEISHPASTKKVPIIAAYTIVLGGREMKPNEGALHTREYTLWFHGHPRSYKRRLSLALREETLSPEGKPSKNDRFLEFDKNELRFGERTQTWRCIPGTPNWSEIGAAATPFLGHLYGRFYRPSNKIRLIPEAQTAKILRESGMALYNLNRSDNQVRFSLARLLPDGTLQSVARLCVVSPVHVGWKAADHDGRAGILGLPASGADPLLLSYLRAYGVGNYQSELPLNALFSLAGLKGLFLEKMDRPPKRASYKARLKYAEKWNAKPAGRGPFDDFLGSNFRAWRAFGYPPRVGTLKIEVSSIPDAVLQSMLDRLSPGIKLADLRRVYSSDSRPYHPTTIEKLDQLGVQLFAVSDKEGHCGVVFDGKLRWGGLSPDALARLDQDDDDRAQEFVEEMTNGKPLKVMTLSFNQECPLFLSDFLRVLPNGTERPMQVEDFSDGPWIEIPRC